MMFGAGVANVYAAPPVAGSLRATLQGGSAQLAACFCASFLNGYIKTFIFTHVSEIRAPAGQQLEAARFQQIVSRRLSTAVLGREVHTDGGAHRAARGRADTDE